MAVICSFALALAASGDPAVVLEWIDLVIAIALALAPAIVAVLKLTAWGRANAQALEEVVDAVGQARKAQEPAVRILDIMGAKELGAVDAEVVAAWKRAVAKRDPKR
jgi:hypothetical protein